MFILTNKSEIYSKGDQNDSGNTMNQDTNEVSLKQNSIAQTENLSLLKTATIDCLQTSQADMQMLRDLDLDWLYCSLREIQISKQHVQEYRGLAN